jgi:hypothetical protein
MSSFPLDATRNASKCLRNHFRAAFRNAGPFSETFALQTDGA